MAGKKPYKRKGKPRATPGQKLLLVALGIGLIGVLELVLRLFGAGGAGAGEDPFVGFSGYRPVFETYTDDSGIRMARLAEGKQRWFNEQEFRVEKTAGVFRIATLGGSTTYGRPYADRTSFSGWLEELLNVSPEQGRRYEVINAGGISYASYRVAIVLEEMLSYDPDLVVIYTGHNEFLEARTYSGLAGQPSAWLEARDMLSDLRLYRVIEQGIDRARSAGGDDDDQPAGDSPASVLGPEVQTLLDRSAGLDYYQRDSLYAHGVFEHFRFNISRMIETCREAGVPVVFCEPVDNLKDFSPFKSLPSAAAGSSERFQIVRLLGQARGLLESGQPREALGVLKEAAGMEPLYAETWFLTGRALLATGDTSKAATAFLEAREMDIVPLRAQEPVHEILREETAGAGVPLLELPAMFAQYSPGGIIGNETLLDHIHPLPEYHLQIAALIARWMIDQGFFRGELPEQSSGSRLFERVMGSLGPEYFSRGVLNLAKVLVWAQKYREVRGLFDSRWDEVSGLGEAWLLRAVVTDRTGDPAGSLEYFGKAMEMMPENRQIYREYSGAARAAGQPGRAREIFESGLDRFPDDVPLLSNYGIMLAHEGEQERAMELFERARRIDPNAPEVYNNMGLLHSMQGHYGDAIANFRRAIEAAPGSPQGYHNLGMVYMVLERYPEAESAMLEALRLNPQHASARNNLGNVYMLTGRVREAEEQWRISLTLDPGRVEVYINLALLYRDTDRRMLALQMASRGLQLFPGEPRLTRIVEELRGR